MSRVQDFFPVQFYLSSNDLKKIEKKSEVKVEMEGLEDYADGLQDQIQRISMYMTVPEIDLDIEKIHPSDVANACELVMWMEGGQPYMVHIMDLVDSPVWDDIELELKDAVRELGIQEYDHYGDRADLAMDERDYEDLY